MLIDTKLQSIQKDNKTKQIKSTFQLGVQTLQLVSFGD